ncbi:LysM peptidoglycan-binding domain-containing protein [Brevibacillus sp. NPDC058079]|uniref:LysM peptidoglycan-binding domain-containing protein n=1 Tax=Brevibacillus sp. NPDC058079 TaxID=3346330 RepID=UPI0036E26FAF
MSLLGKNKLMLSVLLLTFVSTSGMFYYDNIYLKKQDQANKVTVLVMKKDIAKGTEFSTDNIGAIKIDKEMVLPTYITKFDDVKGKTATSDLLANEVVTKPRVNEGGDGTRQFSVGVEAKNMPVSIKKGDAVRVFVQTEVGSKVYEVFEKKEVYGVNYKKSSAGKDTPVVQSIDLLLSDKEAVTYFDAQKTGNLLVIRYHDLTEKDTTTVPRFEENADELLQLQADSKKRGGNKTDTTVSYVVKKGDTFESIAKAHGSTEGEIKEQNPGVVTLHPGDKLQIKKK